MRVAFYGLSGADAVPTSRPDPIDPDLSLFLRERNPAAELDVSYERKSAVRMQSDAKQSIYPLPVRQT